jgi:phosphatidylglycerophosphate synthase
VLGADALVDAALVQELQARARPGAVIELEADGARARVAPGPLVGDDGTPGTPPRAGVLRRAGAPGGEQALLRGLENPRDGYLDGSLNRRVSPRLSGLLLRTPISPNLLTLLGITVGVAGGLLVGVPGTAALAGALLALEASALIDCSDGELARICHAESRLGHVLDITGDTVVSLALLWGIAARLAASGDVPGWPALGSLLLGVLGAFAVITWSDSTEDRRRGMDVWENRVLDGILSPLTTRDWYVFPAALALAGRLDVLVPGAAIGAHVFWLVTLVLHVRVLRRAPAAV